VPRERRQFTREFKLEALARFETTTDVSGLARELGVRRELLYRWQAKLDEGRQAALKTTGRPRSRGAGEGPETKEAGDRIAELERKIGRQQIELDFFRAALQQVRGGRRGTGGPGGKASTR
jgi:transposase-like protein